jgi:glucose-6-phosphate 1-epimerase
VDATEHLFHGMPAIRWRSRDGAAAIATLQGGHVVSWVPAGGREALFVSERSAFAQGRAIRGGVPVCFPQFADRGPLAQHGFARNLPWRHAGTAETEEGAAARFVLEDSADTSAWPRCFRLELVATIGGSRLQLTLRVTNLDAQAFTFTAALHTYLAVSESATAALRGLRGVRYVNRGEPTARMDSRAALMASEPIDRVYFSPPGVTMLEDSTRTLRIEQRGFTDTVVWNPGRERTAAMPDMAPEGYRHMLCVEAAAIEPAVALAPAAEWSGTQSIAISP